MDVTDFGPCIKSFARSDFAPPLYDHFTAVPGICQKVAELYCRLRTHQIRSQDFYFSHPRNHDTASMPHWHVQNRGWQNEEGQFGPPPKKRYAFVWPNDAKRSKAGRFRDILTSRGPDMFVATNPNRAPGALDGPTRRRWAGHMKLEDNELNLELDAMNFMGGVSRSSRPHYDFLTRRYRREYYPGMWTDVKRYPGAPLNTPSAIEYHNFPGRWVPLHPKGNHRYMDPVNFGMNYVNGEYGGGGHYHPGIDGWPGVNR